MMRSLWKKLEHLSSVQFWILVAGLALASRLAFLVYWQKGNFNALYGYDSYMEIAKSWLGWKVNILDVDHPPLYCFWVLVWFWIMGRPCILVLQILNIILASVTCVLLGLWGERAISKPVGRLAAAWAAVDPHLIFFSVQVQSEPFFIFLVMVFFLWLWRVVEKGSSVEYVGLGFLGGLMSLTRSVFAGFLPFLCGALLLREFRGRSLVACLLLILGWGLPIAGWSMRNWVKYRAFIPLAVNGGWNLYEGFTLDREEVRRRPYEMAEEIRRKGIDTAHDPTAASEYFRKKVIAFARERPWEAAKIILGKFFKFWRPWPYDPHSKKVRILLSVYFSILFILAFMGIWALWSRWRTLCPVYALFLCLSVVHSIQFTSLRYRVPLEPFLCFFASAGMLNCIGRYKCVGLMKKDFADIREEI